MVTLRRVGVRSAARVGFWFGLVSSIIQILVVLTILLVVLRVPPPELLNGHFIIRLAMGILFSGINAGISALIFAFVYNIASRASGGLQLDFEMPDTPTVKRKNGESEEA